MSTTHARPRVLIYYAETSIAIVNKPVAVSRKLWLQRATTPIMFDLL
jgi:hypothetical protein